MLTKMTIDGKPFDIVFKKYHPRIFRYLLKKTRESGTAEDLTSEVFLKVVASRDKYKDYSNFGAWIFSIASNTFINWYRRKKLENSILEQKLEIDDFHGISYYKKDQEELFYGEEFQHKARKIIFESLDERFANTINLVDILDMNYKETAEITDAPLGTIMSRLHRARKRIRANKEFRELVYG